MPFIRTAFIRSDFELVHTETHVEVPATRLAEAFFRVVIVVAVVAAGWYFVHDKLMPPEKRIVTREELLQSFDADDEETFEETIKHTETELLIELVGQPDEFDPNTPAHNRTRSIKYKILAVQRIAKSRMLSRKIDGLTKELGLRSQLALINLENNIVDPEANKELLDLARLYKTIQFEEDSEQLNQQAKIGEIIGNMVEFVDAGSDKSEASKINEILNNLDEIGGQFLKNSPLGQKLTRLSELVRQNLSDKDRSYEVSNELEQRLDEIHNQSKVFRVSALNNMDCSNFGATNMDSLENAFDDPFTVKFRDALERVLEISELGSDEYQIVLEKLEMVSRSGWNNAAQQMLLRTNREFKLGQLDEEILARSQRFQARLAQMGEALPIDAFTTLTGSEARLKSDRALLNAILFISFEQKAASDARMSQLLKICADSGVPALYLNVAIVLVHDDDKMNGKPGLETQSQKLRSFSWWQLNQNSRGYQEFKDVVSTDSSPYVLVLDKNKKVVSVDPGPVEFQDLIKKMIPRNRPKQ